MIVFLKWIFEKKLIFKKVGRQQWSLTLKAPIMTAADDKFCDIFPNFRKK